jgi:hypothetical protein
MGAAVMVVEAAVTDLAGEVAVMASVEVSTGVSAATALVAGSVGRADFEIVVLSVLDIRIIIRTITHILIIWDTSALYQLIPKQVHYGEMPYCRRIKPPGCFEYK